MGLLGENSSGCRHHPRPALPIVITSGHDLETATNDTQGLADACLKKPFRVENLRQVLESLVSRRAGSRA